MGNTTFSIRSLWMYILLVLTVFMPMMNISKTNVNLDLAYDTTKPNPAECSFENEHAKVSASTQDGVQVVGGLFLKVLTQVWTVYLPPGFGELAKAIIGNIPALWNGGFDVASLFEDDDSDEAVYDTMQSMFTTLWDCTVNYVTAIQDEIMQDVFKEEVIDAIKDRYMDVMTSMDNLQHQYPNANNVRNYYLHYTSSEINDYVDAFPWAQLIETDEKKKAEKCRSLLPFIATALNVKILLYTHYASTYNTEESYLNIGNFTNFADFIDFADFADFTDFAGFENFADLQNFQQETLLFRDQNGKLLSIYNFCAPYALKESLLEANSIVANGIAKELNTLYNADAFCSWVNITYYWTVNNMNESSYIFAENYGEYGNFSYFKNNCNQQSWERYVIDKYQSIYPNAMQHYQLDIAQWTSSEALVIDKILFFDTCPPCGPKASHHSCIVPPKINAQHSLSLSYGTVQGNLIMTDYCHQDPDGPTHCSKREMYDDIGTTNADCSWGSVITGARYLTYHESFKKMHIGGIQFVCSDPQTTWTNNPPETHFLQIDSNYKGAYAWSKFYICPSGYYLNMAIDAFTSCNYHYHTYKGFLTTCMQHWWKAFVTPHVTFRCIKYEDTREFAGCYTDKTERAMQIGPYTFEQELNPNDCAEICKNQHRNLYAIQTRKQCFCDSDLSFKKYGASEDCDFPFGGRWANAVYGGNQPKENLHFVYLGCYNDTGKRAMDLVYRSKEDLTQAQCATKCKNRKYFAIQLSTQCFCGDDDSFKQYGDSDQCNFPFGGSWANAVYANYQLEDIQRFPFLGCYQDKKKRTMQLVYTSAEDLTQGECANKCKNRKYFAIQLSTKCFCGDDDSFKQYGDSQDCNFPFGGSWANAVYINQQI